MVSMVLTLLLGWVVLMCVGFVISALVGLVGKGAGFGFEESMEATKGALIFGVVISLFAFLIIGFGYGGNFDSAIRTLGAVFVAAVLIGYFYNMSGVIRSRLKKNKS